MGKQTQALYNQLIGLINQQMNTKPEVNESQKYLTDQALAAAHQMDTGDFSTLPKNMFFNFSRPAEQKRQYEQLSNASNTGTFALGDTAGMGQANALQSKFMKDRFARDVGENYQNNIASAAGNVQNALAQSSSAEANRIAFEDQRKMGVINALGNLYQQKASQPSGWGAALRMIGNLGSAAINKIPF